MEVELDETMISSGQRSGTMRIFSIVTYQPAILACGFLIGVTLAISSATSLLITGILGITAALLGLCVGRIFGAVHPSIGLCLLVLSVPLRSFVEIELGGYTVGMTEAVLPVAVVWLIIFRRPGPFVFPKQSILLLIFIGLSLITALWAYFIPAAFKELAKWIEVLVALLAAFDLARNPRDLRPALIVGGIAMTGEAIVGLAQTALGIGPQSFLVGKIVRAYGTFDQPNPFAGYLALNLSFMFAFVCRGKGWQRCWVSLLWLTGATALILSLSRGGWVALAVGFSIVVWHLGARNFMRSRLWILGIALPIVVLAVGHFTFGLDSHIPNRARLVGEGMLEPIAVTQEISPKNFALVQRLAFWVAAARMFASNPIGGIGLGNYEYRYDDFNLGRWNDPLGHAHNLYLNVAAETGILGLLPLVAFLATTIVGAYRAAARNSRLQTAAIGSLASMGAFLAHNMVDNVFVGGMGVLFGVLAGLTLATSRKDGEFGQAG